MIVFAAMFRVRLFVGSHALPLERISNVLVYQHILLSIYPQVEIYLELVKYKNRSLSSVDVLHRDANAQAHVTYEEVVSGCHYRQGCHVFILPSKFFNLHIHIQPSLQPRRAHVSDISVHCIWARANNSDLGRFLIYRSLMGFEPFGNKPSN